jgi:hypothetical protein
VSRSTKGITKERVNQSYRQFSADMIEVTGKDFSLHVPGETTPRQLAAREFARQEGDAHPLQ